MASDHDPVIITLISQHPGAHYGPIKRILGFKGGLTLFGPFNPTPYKQYRATNPGLFIFL